MILFIALGLVNWFATVLIVESEFFRPLRDWVARRPDKAKRLITFLFWEKVDFMINCHMCAGTWVGLALAFLAPALFGAGVIPFVVTALLIKAIGHLVLVAHKAGERYANSEG